MQKFLFFSFLIGCVFLGSVTTAYGAALTNDQINAILSLLRSFGAEEQVVINVESSLRDVAPACPQLQFSLFRGVTDETSNGEVSWVQAFLDVELPRGYFGPLTEKAVQEFQVREGIVASGSSETTGFGVVGPKTRTKLYDVCVRQNSTQHSSTIILENIASEGQTPEKIISVDIHTNTISAEYVRSVLKNIGVDQGLSPNELATIDETLTEVMTASSSFNDLFRERIEAVEGEEVSGSNALSSALASLAGSTAATIAPALVSQIISTLSVSTAAAPAAGAAALGIPFGGTNHYITIPCTCSGTFLLIFPPLPPTYASALTYLPGTQLFASYTLPLSRSILGRYVPPGICFVGVPPACVPIPSQGMILPPTGSSPI